MEQEGEGSRKAPFQKGSTDTVIEINEKREKPIKLDSPGKFRSPRRSQNSGEKSDRNNEGRRKDKEEGSNGEKRHKKRKKIESTQSIDVTDARPHGSGNFVEEVKRLVHSPIGGLSKKHRRKKLSKENLDKLQVQIEMEDEDKHPGGIRRKPTESSSDIEEVDERVANDRYKRKLCKEDQFAEASHLHKVDSLEVEYRNLSREFISPKRKQLLKQLKYKNRRYQIYCDDVGMSRSLEHEMGAPRQDENKSKSLNHLLEHR